jgi:hypothetical protein
MAKIYVYVCPVDGEVFESDEDLGETTPCPDHPTVLLRKEGEYEVAP